MSNTRCRIIRLLAGLGVVTAIPFFALAKNSIDINFDNSGSQSATQKAPAVSQPSTATEASQAGLGGPAVESVAVSGENRQTNVIISGKELRKPSVRKIEGQKLVVQFPGTTLKIPSRIEEKDHLVTAIRSSDHEGTAWVVLDTHGFKKWKIRKNSTGYVLTLFSRGLPARTVSSVPPQVEASGAGESSSEGKKTIARLTDLSLKPMEGGLKVVLTSDGPAKYTVRKLVQPEKLAIRFHGALLEISDKDAKLKEAKGFQKQGLLLLELRQIGPRYSPLSEALLTLLPGTTHQVSRDLNQVVITLTAPPAFGKTVEKKGSLDQLVSIDLEGADLTAVLKTLGSEAGFNVDFANPVVGVVNEKLKDVPLRNALALLLGPGSYDYGVQGGTIRDGAAGTPAGTQ